MPSPSHKGWRTSGSSHGDDIVSDGASLAGPQPYEGVKQSPPDVSPVPSECGLEPKGDHRPTPMVGFLRLQAGEEANL
jgi:hypothetical protein